MLLSASTASFICGPFVGGFGVCHGLRDLLSFLGATVELLNTNTTRPVSADSAVVPTSRFRNEEALDSFLPVGWLVGWLGGLVDTMIRLEK